MFVYTFYLFFFLYSLKHYYSITTFWQEALQSAKTCQMCLGWLPWHCILYTHRHACMHMHMHSHTHTHTRCSCGWLLPNCDTCADCSLWWDLVRYRSVCSEPSAATTPNSGVMYPLHKTLRVEMDQTGGVRGNSLELDMDLNVNWEWLWIYWGHTICSCQFCRGNSTASKQKV